MAALPRCLPDHRVLSVPAWDTLPYDRARPSRRVTGTRVASLASLVEAHDQPILVLTTPEALPQRVPPAERMRERSVWLAAGDELDPEWLRATLVAFGYVFDERVDEPFDGRNDSSIDASSGPPLDSTREVAATRRIRYLA